MMIVLEGGQVDKGGEIERARAVVVEEELERSSKDDLGVVKAPRVTMGGGEVIMRIYF
jgi:hypothetical protein